MLEAHGTKKLWKEKMHFPIGPVRGNVVVETEEASGECLREARRAVLVVLCLIPRLANKLANVTVSENERAKQKKSKAVSRRLSNMCDRAYPGP